MWQAFRRVMVRGGILHPTLNEVLYLVKADKLRLHGPVTMQGHQSRYTGENRYLNFVFTSDQTAEVLHLKLHATGDDWFLEFMENRTSNITFGIQRQSMTTLAKEVAQQIYKEVWHTILLYQAT